MSKNDIEDWMVELILDELNVHEFHIPITASSKSTEYHATGELIYSDGKTSKKGWRFEKD
jgi:hypothetical protein